MEKVNLSILWFWTKARAVDLSVNQDIGIDHLQLKLFVDNWLYIERQKAPLSVYSCPYVRCSSDQGSNPA